MAIYGFVSAFIVLALDQISKYWVLYGLDLPSRGTVKVFPFLNFTMVWNHAVTFGLFRNHWAYAPFFFSAIALLVCAGLIWWMLHARRLLVAVCLGMIIGGALGNVCDRLHFGAVVDFLHLHLLNYSWYVFNIADSSIVCAVIVLMFLSVSSRDMS